MFVRLTNKYYYYYYLRELLLKENLFHWVHAQQKACKKNSKPIDLFACTIAL